jgi:putative transferase (TIGR04331 family)
MSRRKYLYVANDWTAAAKLRPTPGIGQAMPEYLAWQIRFFKAVGPLLQRQIDYRPYPHEYGWHQDTRIQAMFPEVRIRRPNRILRRFERELWYYDAIIVDHLGTSFLQVLAAQRPLIAFWKPEWFALRPSMRAYFDELKDRGVYHENPISAAFHLQRADLKTCLAPLFFEVQSAQSHAQSLTLQEALL